MLKTCISLLQRARMQPLLLVLPTRDTCQELRRYCAGIAQVLRRYCAGIAQVLRRYCAGIAQVLRRYCAGIAPYPFNS